MDTPLVRLDGPRFVDTDGRTLLLRGMNLGAASKLPSRPAGETHLREGFYNHRDVSFVGRPLALAEADEHLERCASWGFTHLRLAVTWEAVEHAGPGIYDTAFLDYLEELVRRIGMRGMTLQVDPHQDVWSRFTGGSGAPGWTLEAAGMDVTRVHETGAAVLHQVQGDPFPRMIWPTNATKLAAATMFTLFFGGSIFAPELRMEGEQADGYLQRHFCAAMAQVAARLKGFRHVTGYETMNEPQHGFVGHGDIGRLEGLLHLGDSPTPFQSMLLGDGYPQEVPVHDLRLRGVVVTGRRVLNPGRARLWRDSVECPWRRHGLWDVGPGGDPRLLRPGHFAKAGGRAVDFAQDLYRPFANSFARTIRAVHPDVPILLQTEVGMRPPRWGTEDAGGIVFAPHWYDSLTLVMKRYNALVAYDSLRNRLVVGRRAIDRSIAAQLSTLGQQSREHLRGAPVVLGETGIPFDLRNSRPGTWKVQAEAADRVMRGVESSLVSACWWNYAAANERVHGDGWNGEDFSVFRGDLPAGGRALEAIVRPYPRAVAGDPLSLRFHRASGAFAFTFRHRDGVQAPTELFVPALQYPHGCSVTVSDGTFSLEGERLVYRHSPILSVHEIRIGRKKR